MACPYNRPSRAGFFCLCLFRPPQAIRRGCGAAGGSGTLSSMDAAMSPMEGFTRVPLPPAAPHPNT